MSEVGTILASGAVGVAGSVATAYVLRITSVGADVRRHDRRARAVDADLECWVMDDHRRLEAEIGTITARHNGRGTLHSGMALNDVAGAKTRALQRFRDRWAESERALADMLSEETWMHELYRRWMRCGPLKLSAREQAEPILDRWRSVTQIAGMTDQTPVFDPTRVTLAEFAKRIKDD